jgi:hypothetical protein
MHDPRRRGEFGCACAHSQRDATRDPSPARRVSTIFNSAACIPRLAHPKLRTAPRESAGLRGPGRGYGRNWKQIKNISRVRQDRNSWIRIHQGEEMPIYPEPDFRPLLRRASCSIKVPMTKDAANGGDRVKREIPHGIAPSDFMRELRPEYFSDTQKRAAYVLSASALEYHLETITSRNQTHDFEIFCRKLCERAICPNLRPQTGPEGGGDSKADTETYPVADEISRLTYEGHSPDYSSR